MRVLDANLGGGGEGGVGVGSGGSEGLAGGGLMGGWRPAQRDAAVDVKADPLSCLGAACGHHPAQTSSAI